MPQTSRQRYWGTIYQGSGDPEQAAVAAEAACSELGMSCTRRSLADGSIGIEAIQVAPWYRILLHRLPQRVGWRMEGSGDRLVIHCDVRPFRWYTVLMVLLCLAAASVVVHDVLLPEPRGGGLDSTAVSSSIAVLLAFLGLSWVWLLVAAAVGDSAQLWRSVARSLEESGGFLDKLERESGRRFALSAAGFLSFVFVLVSLAVARHPVFPKIVGFLSWYKALVGTCVIWLVLGAALFLRRAVALRSASVLGGLGSGFALFIWLAVPLPFVIAESMDINELRLGSYLRAQQKLILSPQASEGVAERREKLRAFRLMCWFSLAGPVVFGLFSTRLMVSTLDISRNFRTDLRRLKRHRKRKPFGDAVRGGPVLFFLRASAGLVWIFLAASLFVGISFAVLCGLHAAFPPFDHPALRVTELSALMSAFALGRPLDDPWIGLLARAGWVLYGLTAAALLTLSVGQLVASRRSLLRRLRASSSSDPQAAVATALVSSLCRKAQLPAIRLAVISSPRVEARSHLFGLGRGEHFIEVSDTALRRLRTEDIAALLAHECAHHQHGHCRTDNLLRFLGRLTFVGDGFVRGLEDSFGYEQAADQTAVCELGADREALVGCLLKERHVNSIVALRTERSALGLAAGNTELGVRKEEDKSWREACRLFLDQYCGRLDLTYWHPAHEERLAFLRTMRCQS